MTAGPRTPPPGAQPARVETAILAGAARHRASITAAARKWEAESNPGNAAAALTGTTARDRQHPASAAPRPALGAERAPQHRDPDRNIWYTGHFIISEAG